MSEHEGRSIVWQWQDAGSGAGHMQAVYGTTEPAADTVGAEDPERRPCDEVTP